MLRSPGGFALGNGMAAKPNIGAPADMPIIIRYVPDELGQLVHVRYQRAFSGHLL